MEIHILEKFMVIIAITISIEKTVQDMILLVFLGIYIFHMDQHLNL